jgi:hypothetical protein
VKSYFRRDFAIDIVVVVPDWLFTILYAGGEGDGGNSGSSKLLKALRAFRIARLLRLTKLRHRWNDMKDRVNSEIVFIVVSIIKKVSILLMINHFICTIWYAISRLESDNWVKANGYEDASVGAKYTVALHWSLTQFTPASMDVHPVSVLERTFAIVVVTSGLVYFSSFISSITASMQQLRHMNEEFGKQYWLLRRYLRQHSVSQDLTLRIISFYEDAWTKKRDLVPEAAVTVMQMLSLQLKDELRFEVNFACLCVHPLLQIVRDRSRRTLLKLVENSLASSIYALEDFVFQAREVTNGTYFVASGMFRYAKTEDMIDLDGQTQTLNPAIKTQQTLNTLACFEEDDVWQNLEEGTFMCEPALWTPWVHLGIMQSISNSTLITIKSKQFAIDCKADAEMHPFMLAYAERYLEKLNAMSLRKLSDWFDPSFAEEIIDEIDDKQTDKSFETSITTPFIGVPSVGLGKLITSLAASAGSVLEKPYLPGVSRGRGSLRSSTTPSSRALPKPGPRLIHANTMELGSTNSLGLVEFGEGQVLPEPDSKPRLTQAKSMELLSTNSSDFDEVEPAGPRLPAGAVGRPWNATSSSSSEEVSWATAKSTPVIQRSNSS